MVIKTVLSRKIRNFIGPKLRSCVVVTNWVNGLVETWLMWPWRVKMLSNLSLLMLNWIVGFVKVETWICQDCYMDLLKLLHVFLALCETKLKFDQTFEWRWICQNWYLDFSKLLHGFLKIDIWISLSCSMYFWPFAKQNQAEVWPRVQS